MVGPGPLEELDLSHDARLHPNAFLHLLGRKSLSPSSPFLLGKVHKRAICRLQRFERREYLPPRERHKTGADPGRIVQLLAPVDAYHDGINAEMTGAAVSSSRQRAQSKIRSQIVHGFALSLSLTRTVNQRAGQNEALERRREK
jgi:hypothetical protein